MQLYGSIRIKIIYLDQDFLVFTLGNITLLQVPSTFPSTPCFGLLPSVLPGALDASAESQATDHQGKLERLETQAFPSRSSGLASTAWGSVPIRTL